MSDWRAYLRQNDEANQSFADSLHRLIEGVMLDMDRATSWEEVLEARGKKKVLEFLVNSLTMAEKEEVAYARVFGHARATKSA